MILTLVLLSIGALLFLVIAYNVVQQYKQKAEADKRHAIARHKSVVDETEEMLLNVNLVPFSKNIVLLLQHRILDAYRAIALVMPSGQLKQRIADVQTQIKNVQENYSSQDEGTSRPRSRIARPSRCWVIPRKTRVLISRIFPYLERRRFYMKTSRFSDTQIIAILKQAEAGAPVPELCREHGISTTTFYKWRSKFGGMDASLMARLKELEDENRRLKKMYAEERLKAEIITEAMAKKW